MPINPFARYHNAIPFNLLIPIVCYSSIATRRLTYGSIEAANDERARAIVLTPFPARDAPTF
jgi:hypothetical protein